VLSVHFICVQKREPPFDLGSGSERVSSFCVDFLAHFSFSYWMKEIKTKNENAENRRTGEPFIMLFLSPSGIRTACSHSHTQIHTFPGRLLLTHSTVHVPDEPGRILHKYYLIGARESGGV
jgi:hypothetical protein